MDDETAHRLASERMMALGALGPERGAGAHVWARTVLDELERHEAARQRFATNTADRDAWLRLHGSALMLVVAIDQVLAFERRVRKITGDAELARARAVFDEVGAEAEAIRDVAIHLDAYAVGEGKRQTGRERAGESPVGQANVSPLIYWPDEGGTVLNLAGAQVDLRTVAEATVTLAEVVEGLRVKHLQRAASEADAAFKRRWMPDPD